MLHLKLFSETDKQLLQETNLKMSYKQPHKLLCLFWGLIVTLGANCVHAEDTEFEAWKRQQANQFKDFETAEDKAFAEFLRKEWQEFQIFKGNVRDATPKPATPPAIRNETRTAVNNQPSPVKRTSTHKASLPATSNNFFGHTIGPITFPAKMPESGNLLSSEIIADTWTQLARQDHTAVLQELESARQRLTLGDWGTIRLIDQLLAAQFPEQNQRTFYLWFLLTKMGFDTQVGYTQTQLVLLLPTKNKLFGVRYSEINDTPYYMFPEPEDNQLVSYQGGAYSRNRTPFDFTLTHLIKPAGFIDEVNIEYSYQAKVHPIKLKYDAGFSEFLATYPQIDLPEYFRVRPSSPVYENLREQLQPHIKAMQPRQAVNYLLGLTQFLFEYKTDTDQFGQEKYLVVEESLYYGTNDCEDRSIFLAWLIYDLLQLELVVLDYPGHVALAVKTDISADDDLVSFKGRKFVIVDPTYLGAEAGNAMPSVANLEPQFIEVGYTESNAQTAEKMDNYGHQLTSGFSSF